MGQVTLYDAARQALAEARAVDEVKQIRDKAVALQAYAQQAKDRQLMDHATDIRSRAEQRAGEMLHEMGERKERHSGRGDQKTGSQAATPKLSDLGITKTQSSRWQKLAAMAKEQFDAYRVQAKKRAAAAMDATFRAEMKQEKRAADEARIPLLAITPGKYRTLVIDPPWDHQGFSLAGRGRPEYAVMSQDELLALPVAQWAEDECHLYLWATNNFVPRAVALMEAWGFDYKTLLTGVKPYFGLGSYFRSSTEQVLFGVRGAVTTRAKDIPTHFAFPRGEHSAKPDNFYDMVRRASYPPYGEVFQRAIRADFANVFAEQALRSAG